jgi:hypothetical protein
MPQDPVERIQALLFEDRVNPHALLLDLVPLIPESMLEWAARVVMYASDDRLRGFLIDALAKRLPSSELTQLTKDHPIPRGAAIADVTIPEGEEAKEWIAQFPEDSRYAVFAVLLSACEPRVGMVEKGGGVASVDPPDNVGGEGEFGFASGEARFAGRTTDDDDDDGFEAVGPVDEEETKSVEDDSGFQVAEPDRPDVVNLGFSQKHAADRKLQKQEPLQRGQSYYFWLRIGKDVDEAAIGTPSPIDLKKLPEEAVLTVAVFGFENELAITPGHDLGELKIQKDGKVKVLRQPVDNDSFSLSDAAPADYLNDYLLFPISVPDNEATHRLRCNIYCAQVLVQSYVISANVKSTSDPVAEACTQRLDYVLSQSLRASHLVAMTKEPHLLSLMVNNNGDGSHSFRFFGTDGSDRFKDDARIDGQQLAGFLKQARRAMHKVSWGNEEEWDETKGLAYRYQTKTFDLKKLAKDLAYLARAGWRIYTGFVSHLSTTAAELETLMANPGLLQIALKLSPRAVVPAAVIYDYAWMPDNFDFEKTEFELCPTFSDAIDKARNGGPALEECDCFKGGCALKKMIAEVRDPDSDKTLGDLPPMICPSGFWGYRHLLGLPLTLDGTNKDVPPVINYKDDVQFVACVSTDPMFVERDPHLGRLQQLKGEVKVERDEGYKAIVRRLKKTTPHLLYFYCHGGIRANTELPYLEIGERDRFGPEALIGEGISWKGPNPLVFINGCHTTSLNPEITLDAPHDYIKTGGKGHKFGIPHDEVVHVALIAAGLVNVDLVGLDMHLGSQLSRIDPYREGTERLGSIFNELTARGIDTLRYLDIGGGLGVRYDTEQPPDLARFAEMVLPTVARTGLHLIMEPGRYVVGNAGALVAEVLYRKRSGGKDYVVVDAGMTELLRPSHYGAYHRIQAVAARDQHRVVDVVGPVCESGDFLALERELDDVSPGDLIIVYDAGAYGYAMASNYNSRMRPAEVLVSGDRFALVTRREQYDDLLRLEIDQPEWRR